MNEPKIRFKGFEGEWKRQSLGDISASFSGGTPAVSVSDYYGGNIPFIRSGEIHENRTQLYITQAGLNNSSAKIVEKGTILYALYGATSGDVGFSKLRGAINQAILAIEPTKKYIDRIFLVGFLQSYKHRIINELLQGGQGNLSGSLVKKILLAFPSLPEQRALASYFTSLDAQIAASTSRLSSLKQIKAASLLNMFPQKGETVPRVRFKGFQGEWKERKLGEIAIVNPKCDLPKSFEYVDLESVVGTEMKSHRREFRESAPSRAQRLARKGDIFYQTVRPYQKNNYLFNLDYSDYVFSSGYAQIQALKDERFLFTVVQSDYFLKQVMDNCTGTSFPSINPTLLRNLIVYDCSIDEQRAIGQYFTALDAQITLHRERLEKLKQIKAACLEKMFA